MRLVQFKDGDGARRVASVSPDGWMLQLRAGVSTVYEIALDAARRRISLETVVDQRRGAQSTDYDAVVREGRLLPPLDRPDPYHCLVTYLGPPWPLRNLEKTSLRFSFRHAANNTPIGDDLAKIEFASIAKTNPL